MTQPQRKLPMEAPDAGVPAHMASAIQAFDWSPTALGPPSTWPAQLSTLVQVLLGSSEPTFVVWGPDRTLIYNDAYAQVLFNKHPALGKDFLDVWSEIRGDLEPLVDLAYAGQATRRDHLELVMDRKGYRERTHWSYSYTPIRLEDGSVAGFLCWCWDITRRVETEQRILDSEARHRGVLSNMDEAFTLFDADFNILEVNQRACDLVGLSREELIGRNHWERFPGTYDSDLGRLYRRALASGQPGLLEHLYEFEDGRRRWFETRAFTVGSGVAVLFRDVTVRRELQERATLAAEHLQLAIDVAELGTWRWDVQTDQVTVDERCRRMCGLPPRDDGLSIAEIRSRVHPDDAAMVDDVLARAVDPAGPGSYATEWRWRHPDGRVVWTTSRGVVVHQSIPHQEDRVILIGSLLDTTERKQAEMELSRAHDRLSEATRAGGLGIHEYEPETGRLVWDAQLRQWWGLAPDEEPTYEKFLERIHVDDRAAMQEAVAKALDPLSQGRYEAEYRVTTPEGALRTLRAAGQVNHQPGHGRRLVGTVQDVTRDRQLTAALALADRRKDIFIATLSHELRNPLAPIQSAATMLAGQMLGADRIAWAGSLIERQVRHIALLLDDLLEVSRISQGKLILRRQDVTVAALVEAAVETVRPSIEQRHHRLSLRLPAAPVIVHVDPLRVAQVLSNLLSNAAKYTDPGGNIELAVAQEQDDVVFTVEDNGIGIPADDIATLFEMFAQHPRALQRSEGGLGIGLALAKGLVQLHGGSITGQSAGPGQGSRFIVHLTRAVVRPGPGPEFAEASKPVANPRRVLVIDDNKDGADSLALLLRVQGHEARAAYDGTSGMALARAFRPHVAIIDLAMPGLDGHAVARRLRTEPWSENLTLIALSGHAQAGARSAPSSAGFDHYLVKPAQMEQLAELLER